MDRDKKNTQTPNRTTATMPASKAGETAQADADPMPPEVNGPKGPEPTRYGDWEQKGRCTDF
jgi:hypothetical protein